MWFRTLLFILALATVQACKTGASATRETPAPTDEEGAEGPADPAVSQVEVNEQEVEFSSGGATLKGTLLGPAGGDASRGVVIVHDYGPMGRDGIVRESFATSLPVEVPLYRYIGEALASRGFLVLLYDKRTCLAEVNPSCSYPRDYVEGHPALGDALVEDAVAATKLLRRHGAEQIHLIGHGQGAEVAVAAAGATDADKVVMLAPSAYPADEVVLWQTRESMALLRAHIEKVGDNAEADLARQQLRAVEKQAAEQRAAFEALRAGSSNDEEVLGISADAWRSYFALHSKYMDTLRSGELEVLAVLGDADRDYPPDSATRLQAVLRDEGAFALVSEVGHQMVGFGRTDDPTVVSPTVVELVIDFLTDSGG